MYYAVTSIYYIDLNGNRKLYTGYMHRIILDYTGEFPIDHKNHNTLDNRKSNLRLVEYDSNIKNRKAKNSNNSSGYRNVSKVKNWWYVQMQINGKNTLLKKFPLNQLEEAGAFAKEMREKYYGEFQGNN